jgi:hypothetical protein
MPAYDIVFLSVEDWANVGASLAEACRRIGLNAISAVQKQHAFSYHLKSETANTSKMREIAAGARAVVHMHTQFFPLKSDRPGQKVAVFHGGTRFRLNPTAYAEKYYHRTNLTLIQTGELFGFGCKNETLLIPPIDTDHIQPNIRDWKHMAGGLIFAHYPRATGNGVWAKGTDSIREVMEGFPGIRFWSDTKVVPWEQNLGRMGGCDVYIERLSPEVKEWGLTALEAAALGKVVITNWTHRKEYGKVYSSCPLIIANSQDELRERVAALLSAPAPEIHQLARESREWVVENHGLKPTGERIAQIFDL